MQPNPFFAQIASDKDVDLTTKALTKNGFTVHVVDSGPEAKDKALSLIPEKAEVMTMTSVTNNTIGLTTELDESGHYNSIRAQLNKMADSQAREKRKLAASPDFVFGSVHAITHDGHIYIASNTGSQLAAEVYTASQVIWIVGTQKLVATDELALQRIYEYCYPLEEERAKKAYGIQSNVSKILRINKEVNPERATVILVKEKIGF